MALRPDSFSPSVIWSRYRTDLNWAFAGVRDHAWGDLSPE
jgi:hypothetical protein